MLKLWKWNIQLTLNESGNWNSSLSLVQRIDTQGIHHLGMFSEANETIDEENRCLSFKFIEDLIFLSLSGKCVIGSASNFVET